MDGIETRRYLTGERGSEQDDILNMAWFPVRGYKFETNLIRKNTGKA